MRFACQVAATGLFVLGFFYVLYVDINGREAKAPGGFGAVVSTFIIQAVILALYWGAGVFDGWFR